MSNSKFFRKKLEDIHSNLLEAHRDSQTYAPSITGSERELVQRNLLSLVLPAGYRIGTGTIVDLYGEDSGQVDIVIEQPFSMSFPVVSDNNRLYLASTICAAFEIKSNLHSQGNDAVKKLMRVKELYRTSVAKGEIIQFDAVSIPTFIVAYQGPSTQEQLELKYINPANKLYPNGVLVVESKIFYGRSAGGGWHMARGKAESIFSFLACITESIAFASHTAFNLYDYLKILEIPDQKYKAKKRKRRSKN